MKTPTETETETNIPTVAIEVLVDGTTVGNAELAKGARLRISKSDAEALEKLNPPRVKITGI